MEKRVLRYIREHNMVKAGDAVTVALSGGADSVCLLYLLTALAPVLGIDVSAVHVHHGIRETADRDEQFVRELCCGLHIKLQVVHVDVPQEALLAKTGIEETARKLRYEAFEKQQGKILALAHHSMDQAETLMLNLMRGSGLRGLAGMLPVHGRYIRPLLEETPQSIRGWLTKNGHTWVEDETNQDTLYRRNRLRHEILPLLSEGYNPRLVQTLAATAEILQEDEAALMEWSQRAYSKCALPEGLRTVALMELPPSIRKRCLRMYLKETIGLTDISQKHMKDLEYLLLQQSGHRVVLPRGWEMIREYDRIYAAPMQEKSSHNQAEWRVTEIPGHVTIEPFDRILHFSFVENMENYSFSEKVYTKCFDYDTIKDTLEVRTRRPGDYLTIAGGRKKLKEYLIDTKIPASERDTLLLLADGPHILWVIGYRMSDACKIQPGTKKILQVHCSSISTYEGTEVHHDR